MTPDDFRRLALQQLEAVEEQHMQHPDFRLGGKIFATLGYPDAEHGVVILPPEEQANFIARNPAAFTPVKGAWGRRGSTVVRLSAVDAATCAEVLELAWCRVAPKRLLKEFLAARSELP